MRARPRTALSPAAAQALAAEMVAASRARRGDATMTAGTGEQTGQQTGQSGERNAGQGGETAGHSGEQGGQSGGQQTGQSEPPKQFTQADLDRIVGERVAAEKAKAQKAIEDAQALAGKSETEKLAAERDQAKAAAAEVTKAAAQRIARTEAKGVARDLDVRPDRLDAVLKQADLTAAIGEDGEVDEAKVKAAIEKVVAEYPEWKKAPGGATASGGELNGSNSGKPTFTRDQLEKMSPQEMAANIDVINAAIADGRVTG